jgi:hypothetical protein
MRITTLLILSIAAAVAAGAAGQALAQGFSDDFSFLDPAWVTDRYEPAGFTSAFFDGDYRLKIDISYAQSSSVRPYPYNVPKYDVQGRRRAAAVNAPWLVSGKVYISEAMLNGNERWETELWARTGVTGTETGAKYHIFQVSRRDPSPLAPPVYRVQSNVGWVQLSEPVTGGWHTLSILATGSSKVYSVDGKVIYTDPSWNPFFPNLTTVFVQAYNFTGNYSVYWDDVSASPIPEPMFLQMGALVGFSGLGLLRMRRKG